MSNNRTEKKNNNKREGAKDAVGKKKNSVGRGLNALGNTVDEPTIANNIVAPLLP